MKEIVQLKYGKMGKVSWSLTTFYLSTLLLHLFTTELLHSLQTLHQQKICNIERTSIMDVFSRYLSCGYGSYNVEKVVLVVYKVEI